MEENKDIVVNESEETLPKEEQVIQVETEVAEVDNEVEQKEDTTQGKNFKSLRESKDRIERERDEAVKSLYEYKQKSKDTQVEENYDIDLGEDDLAEGKHLKKVSSHIKKLEAQIKNFQKESASLNVESKLKAQYSDFDNVVSKDNIELLRSTYPELAQTINSSSDLYSKAVSAYTMIKKLGIHKEDNFQQQRELAQKNTVKPKPLTSMSPQQGDSPLSYANAFANGLTDELKQQLLKEMNDAAKSA